MLVDTATGELREARIVTGVDDHSRFCVIARVAERATGRAVCLAFSEALRRFGAPEEVLTDNGKQFTDRFGKGGEVLFDKICRRNGITHRLTQPPRRPRPARSSGSIRRCGASCSTTRARSTRCSRPRLRWMSGSATTTPSARTRRSRPQGRSRRPSASSPLPDEQRELLPLWLPARSRGPAPPANGTVERAIDAGAASPSVMAGRSSSIASSRRRGT